MKTLKVDRDKCVIVLLCVATLLCMPTGKTHAERHLTLLDPSWTENEAELVASLDGSGNPHPGEPASDDTSAESPGTGSYLSQLWELDENVPRDQYALKVHRPNYVLLVTYNDKPNKESPFADTVHDVKEFECTFQLSQKIKLWQDILGKDADLWIAYTQRSFWQVYNTEDSAPFRDTNHEPELLLNFRTDFPFLGMRGRTINVGFNHQSNGRSEPLSRSWNRIVGSVGFEKGNFTLLLKTWYRIPESSEDDDNPNIENYMGYGEIWGYYFWKKHRFSLMLRNNFKWDHNRGAVQAEWSFPLIRNLSGHVQYFYGYGESLLDYNHCVNRIGVGFILKDWS